MSSGVKAHYGNQETGEGGQGNCCPKNSAVHSLFVSVSLHREEKITAVEKQKE